MRSETYVAPRRVIHLIKRSALLIVATLLMSAAVPFGLAGAAVQTTATLLGTVTDQQGAVIPGAAVKAQNVSTGLSRAVTTDEQGHYTIAFLPVGTYTITIEKHGFAPGTVADVVLQIDQRARVDITLVIAGSTETVDVNARAPLINSVSSDIGAVIENTRIVELPLNGRQFIELAFLTAGATSAATKGGTASSLQLAGPMVSVNGARANQNEFTLDGVTITDNLFNTINMSPSVDAIQEFKVQSGLYSAESGHRGGAHVNIILKSGTNDLHGSLFYFLRDEALDAKNFFDAPDQPIPPFSQDQFGFTLGGPIKKNRLFYFGSYEGVRIDQAITAVSSVPPAALRNGDFSGLAAITDPLTGQPFPGNVIPANRIDPVAKAILDFVPLPNGPGLAGNLVSAPQLTNDQNQFNIKIDHRLSEKDSYFGRFSFSNARLFDPFVRNLAIPTLFGPPGFGRETAIRTRNLALSYTRIISSSTINEVKFGFNRTAGGEGGENNEVDFGALAGVIGISRNPNDFGVPRVVTGVFGDFGDNTFFQTFTNNAFQVTDSLMHTKGAHSIRVGGELRRYQNLGSLPQFVRGTFGFNGQYTGNAFADFLLGFPATLQGARGESLAYTRAIGLAGYFQDDWRVTSKLTLNLGVRYEYTTPPVDKFNRIGNFDFQTGKLVIASKDGKIAPGPFTDFVNNNPDLFETSEEAGWPRSLIDPDRNNIAPRIGFAYSPLASNRVAIRGGYGVFYDQFNFLIPLVLANNMPFYNTVFINNTRPLPTLDMATGLATATPTLSPFAVERDFDMGTIQQWGLNIQTQITGSLMAEVGYIGSHGENLSRIKVGNQADPGPGSVASRRPFPAFGDLNLQADSAYSNYHGLSLRLEQRLSRGLSFNLIYTLASSFDTNSMNSTLASETSRPQNSNAPEELEYGPSAFNSRHRFVTSFVYQLPFGPGQTYLNSAGGLLGNLIGGWLVTGIVTHESGKPFSVTSNADSAGIGSRFQRPDVIRNPNLPPSERTPERWFDPQAFVAPPAGSFGSSGRNILIGPSFNNFDFSLIKHINLNERHRFEFRAEFFNLFNHPNLDVPVRIFGSPSLGRILTAGFPRQIQFGLKYIF